MKILKLALVVSALCVAPQVRAEEYNLTYTGEYGIDAFGNLVVVGDQAVGGWLNVASGDDAGNYNLVPGSGSDASFIWDSVIYTGSTPFLDTTGGLQFTDAATGSEVNMFYNDGSWGPAGTYALWGAPPSWNMESYGTATLTPMISDPVPDGGFTVVLLGGALVALQSFRRKLFC